MAALLEYLNDDDELVNVGIDLIDSIQVGSESLVTDLPVESGALVNDNVVSESDLYTLSAVVSTYYGNSPSKTWRTLHRFKEEGRLLSLLSEMEFRQDLVINKLERSENVDTGKSLHFLIGLKQIRQAEVDFITVNREKTEPNEGLEIDPAAYWAQNKTTVEDFGQLYFTAVTDSQNANVVHRVTGEL